MDRRNIALRVYSLLNSLRRTAVVIQVSHSSVSRWLKNLERKQYTRPSKKAQLTVEIIRQTIANDPFVTTRRFQQIILDALNIVVSKELVRTVIKKLGLTRKKVKFFAVPKNYKERVQTFLQERNQIIASGKPIYSLDETSFGRAGRPSYGYAPKGNSLVLQKKPPTSKPASVLAVIGTNGLVARQSKVGAYNKEGSPTPRLVLLVLGRTVTLFTCQTVNINIRVQ